MNFLSNTNDDWKADEEDDMMGYDDDDGDDFGLPSLSNTKRRTRKMAAQRKGPNGDALSPAFDGSSTGQGARRYSNSGDIAIERPATTYPMPKKSEGKILRPQYKDILKGSLHQCGWDHLCDCARLTDVNRSRKCSSPHQPSEHPPRCSSQGS